MSARLRVEQGTHGPVPITEENRFSKFTRHAADLATWLHHFDHTGVPAVVVLTDLGFALYRTGIEPEPFDEID